MALGAVIFDIDGTLIDSNALHREAWRRAFAAHGYKIEDDRIESEIGKGGDQLVPAILGKTADKRDGKTLRAQQPEEYAKLAAQHGLKAFRGALKLIEVLKQRGIQVVFATSSSVAQLKTLEKNSGIPVRQLCDALATGDDAARTKPAPDIVRVAVQKSGLSPAECAMVGDTSYDMRSARDAGVIGMGVESGFQSASLLMRSGARRVWPNVSRVLAELDAFLHCASPPKVQLTAALTERLMHAAIELAREAMALGEAPIACVLADGNGEIIARGFNQFHRTGSRVAHAEMVAFADAAVKRDAADDDDDLILVSTLEPCVMCLGAIMQSGVDTVVYGIRAPEDSGTTRVTPPESPDASMPRIFAGVLEAESRKLFAQFLRVAKAGKQRAFVEHLLRAKPRAS